MPNVRYVGKREGSEFQVFSVQGMKNFYSIEGILDEDVRNVVNTFSGGQFVTNSTVSSWFLHRPKKSSLSASFSGLALKTMKGSNGGIATLDSSGQIPATQRLSDPATLEPAPRHEFSAVTSRSSSVSARTTDGVVSSVTVPAQSFDWNPLIFGQVLCKVTGSLTNRAVPCLSVVDQNGNVIAYGEGADGKKPEGRVDFEQHIHIVPTTRGRYYVAGNQQAFSLYLHLKPGTAYAGTVQTIQSPSNFISILPTPAAQ